MNLIKKQTILLLSAVFVLFTGLSVFASGSTDNAQNPFSFVTGKCNIIGAINLDKIKKIQGVESAIDKTKNDPMYKYLKLSGLTADNIDEIYFGMYIDKADQETAPSFISILKTDKTYNLDKFVDNSKNINDVKVTKETYNKNNVYEFVSTNLKDKQEPVYFAKINSNLLAIGTKDYVEKSFDLLNGKNESILSNKNLMDLSDKAEKKDMLWVAADMPKLTESGAHAAKQAGQDKLPNVKNGIISINYVDNSLNITGKLNCATKQDVQKVLLPAQMFLGIFAMNPDNGLNPQDIQLKPVDKSLDINIKIPEKAINNIIKSQMRQQQGKASQVMQESQGSPLDAAPEPQAAAQQ